MPWTYSPYSSLDPAEQQRIASSYEQKFRDFDNDIIVNSALVPLLTSTDFAENLPATMQDNIEEKEEVLPAVENKRSESEAKRKLQSFDFDKYLDVIEQKKNKYKNSTRTDYMSAVTAAETLHNALTLAKANFIQSQEPPKTAWLDFQTDCFDAIKESREVLEQHRGWKQVLADICSAIVSVVSLGIPNIATGRGMFGLFRTKTDTVEKLDELSNTLEKRVIL
jgi:hypothetical protein